MVYVQCIKVAGIVIAINSDQPAQAIQLDVPYRKFFDTAEAEVDIHAHFDGLPQLNFQAMEKLFDSEMIWKLYRENGKHIFTLESANFNPSKMQ